MEPDILAPDQADIDNYKQSDIFEWANNITQYKDELNIDLFLINKNFTLYKTSLSKDLHKQLEPLFIDDILEFVLGGAETGLRVRGFEEAEDEEGVLQFTQTFKVEKAREVINWLKFQENEIEVFSDEEHDFKRIKGIMARIRHDGLKVPVYVVKVLPRANVMQGRVGWMLRKGTFIPFDAEAALRVPPDNQMLIVDQDLYVFSQTRLKQMFGYNAKEASIAEKKVAEINENFELSFPEGMSLQSMVSGKRSTIKKLQKIEPASIKQRELLDHADELGIELMEDEQGAIIIMDGKDLDKFVNLLNDDYLESGLTGQKYEVIKKRPIKLTEEEPL